MTDYLELINGDEDNLDDIITDVITTNNTRELIAFLEHGLDPNTWLDGGLLLMTAFDFNNFQAFEILIDYGADVEVDTGSGDNLILYIVDEIESLSFYWNVDDYLPYIRILLDYGADPFKRNNSSTFQTTAYENARPIILSDGTSLADYIMDYINEELPYSAEQRLAVSKILLPGNVRDSVLGYLDTDALSLIGDESYTRRPLYTASLEDESRQRYVKGETYPDYLRKKNLTKKVQRKFRSKRSNRLMADYLEQIAGMSIKKRYLF